MKIRLYFENIKINEKIALNSSQSHYLFKVMRQQIGGVVYAFNQNHGEFECKILEISNAKAVVLPQKLIASQQNGMKVACVFSLIKQKNVELLVQKCTEIGVSEFFPLKTERSSTENFNASRLVAIAIEAAEQCGRIDIPQIHAPITINQFEKMQKAGRAFVLLNQNGPKIIGENPNNFKENYEEVFVISGPEGGFSQKELATLANFCQKVKISSNILRAETAAILGCGLVLI